MKAELVTLNIHEPVQKSKEEGKVKEHFKGGHPKIEHFSSKFKICKNPKGNKVFFEM
jgi:hypothetical protein